MSDDKFSIDNLSIVLNKYNFEIVNSYSINHVVVIIRCVHLSTQNHICITIPDKFPIRYEDSLEIVPFTDTTLDTNDRKIVSDDLKLYKEIDEEKDEYLDPTEADKLIEQYQSIDIDSENISILKSNIQSTSKQLQRLKLCTNNILYKICIIMETSISYVNDKNEIETFVLKKCVPKTNETKEIVLIIDLESFYDKINNPIKNQKKNFVQEDIQRVYNNLFTILKDTQQIRQKKIQTVFKNFPNMLKTLNSTLELKKIYENQMNDLKSILFDINRKEEKTKDEMTKLSHLQFSLSDNSYKLKETEMSRLKEYKQENNRLLHELKNKYENLLLTIDDTLFESILLFNQIHSQFKKLT